MAKGRKSLGKVAAALVGAAVGATAVVLSDKKNRKAIMKKVDEVVKEGEEKLEEGVKMVEDAIGGGVRKAAGKSKKAQKATKSKGKSKAGK